jgi:hypothetical protein
MTKINVSEHLVYLVVSWGQHSFRQIHCLQHIQCKTNTIPILMHQMRISTNQVSSVVLRPKSLKTEKHCKNCKRGEKTQYWTMKLNQIRQRIELCMREMILRFRWIYRIYFFLDSLIHIRIFKQVPKYLATGL